MTRPPFGRKVTDERLADLRRDYQTMSVVIFGDPPSLDEILTALGDLESEVNAIK
ncbi:MAG: hypothetical protein IT448_05755 [Phycisphaerales bacterium]|nr:hypothetical protein [Phycisphaerales bacterium]